MADLPSRLDLYAIGRDYVVQRATRLDPAQVDIVGSDVNIYVGSMSHVAYAIVLQLAYAVNRLLLDGAEGEDLDRYAFDRYQLTRKGASSALGAIRVFRATATVGAGTIPAGTRLLSLAGYEYVTQTAITFASGALSAMGAVRAVQAGKATQVGKNQIRKFANLTSLFDTSLQVTNDDVTAGGEDAEDDDTFRERIRDFWNTARRGTLGAIEFGAMQVAGVASAQAIEVLEGDGYPARVVHLYVADSSGVASNELAELVRTSLLDYRAAGIAVVVHNSLPLLVSVSLSLKFQAGVDTSTLTEFVRTAIVEYINSLPVSASVTRAGLASVLQRFTSDGLIVNEASIAAPLGDLVPDLGTTLRTTLDYVTTS